MLKILEPNRKGASLGCRAAPLKNGSRIYEIPANGIHRAEPDQRHQLSIFYLYLTELFLHVLCFCPRWRERKLPLLFFSTKTAQMSIGRWCAHKALSLLLKYRYRKNDWNHRDTTLVKSLFEVSIKKAQNGPSTQLIEETSCVERSNATIKAEEHR